MNMHLYAPETHPPSVTIRALMDQHGILRTLAAVLAALLRPKARSIYAYDLSGHLLRDIGLPPVPEVRSYWELR